jgi:hypothetical protein
MLPDVHDIPPENSESFILGPVPPDVAVDLRPPPFPIILRQHSVLRAAVPKAAVHEDRDLRPSERKIWTSGELGMDPEAEPSCMQLTAKDELRLGILPGHSAHLLGDELTFGCRPNSRRVRSVLRGAQDSCRSSGELSRNLNGAPSSVGPIWITAFLRHLLLRKPQSVDAAPSAVGTPLAV